MTGTILDQQEPFSKGNKLLMVLRSILIQPLENKLRDFSLMNTVKQKIQIIG